MRTANSIGILAIFCLGFIHAPAQNDTDIRLLRNEAEKCLESGIKYMRSLAIEGGYVYHYTLDGKEQWGEGKTDTRTIEVQPPGTPAVGISFLKAYRATGNPDFLEAAKEAADALIRGQNELGGWEHKIFFDRPTGNKVSFDDDQTQSAISFLMALDQEVDLPHLSTAIDKALHMMMDAQMDHGGWPHQYPEQGNYHDYATFNDQGINDCIRVMIEAESYYGKEAYLTSLNKAGRFLIISQLPPPQPGWAQQYNEFLQPAWARSFEPPSVCPSASLNNLHSLMDLYEHTGRNEFLEPIPDAIRWLKASRLPNGKWGRFLELGTNKALYYDRGRIRVESMDQLSLERRTGYGYEVDLNNRLEEVNRRFRDLKNPEGSPNHTGPSLEQLIPRIQEIVRSQDDQGRWIVRQDRFRKEVKGRRWDGEYRYEDRISSALFNGHVDDLCEFLNMVQSPSK